MTIIQVILNLSEKEFANGLTYTAVTRVKKLEDLSFKPFPNYLRYCSIKLFFIFQTLYFAESLGFSPLQFSKREEKKKKGKFN